MINLNVIIFLLFIFFMISIGEIIKLKKEVRVLKKMVKHLLNKKKNKL